jgi:hypothetical protein
MELPRPTSISARRRPMSTQAGIVGTAARRSPLPVLVHHWVSAQAGPSFGPVSSRPVSARRVSSRPASSRLVSARPSCGVRPVSGQPAVALRPAGPAGPSRLECVGFGVACRVPERLRRRQRGLNAGDAWGGRGPTGRGGWQSRVADLGRVTLGLRRRPRSAADRPGRPPWPGSLAAGGYPGPGRATTLRGRCRAGVLRVDSPRRPMSLSARDGRAAPARPSHEVSWPARVPTAP